MKKDRLTRRDINKLGMAAFGGLMAGSVVGCGGPQDTTAPTETGEGAATGDAAAGGDDAAMASADKHLCRGLNSCKNMGASGENACAGQGTCATYAEHSCGGQNECKGQGGCGENPGLNDCKGEGHCAVPLMASAWKTMRARFEEDMKAEGKEVGAAPEDIQWNDVDDWRILANGILSGLSLSALLFGLNLRLRGRRLGIGALFGVMSGLGALLLLPPLLVVGEGEAVGDRLAFACIVYMMPLMALWFLLAAAVGGRLRRKIWSRPMPWTEKFGYLLAMAWSPLGVWMLFDIYIDGLMK
ncbi:unnamed protein product [Cladocopium goreaui]|uniref:Uncharacterized protein n=1 Tax=Cladocopium goreaui TaxID=2562237 RepID=A0A9P1FDL0_9DINO|nr:unnamed protein product [Cladocopium goreaui]